MTHDSTRPPRERLDVLVLARGLVPTRERAQALILAGQILVAGQRADKAGTKYPLDAEIALAEAPPETRYVSRGGLKLEHALDAFHLDPTGLVALDVGASTGGFTDVLLRRGAARVYAIDVGQGQLAWELRTDPRVVVMERTNVRHLTALPSGVQGDCAVIDVSFISLRLVLPAVVALLTPGAWVAALVKPQFEAGKREADRGSGVIRNPAVHRHIITDLLAWCQDPAHGVTVRGLVASPITGREGNREYLLWLSIGQTPGAETTMPPSIIAGGEHLWRQLGLDAANGASAATAHQPNNQQKDHRANQRDDDADQIEAGDTRPAQSGRDPAAKEGADDTDNDVPDQSQAGSGDEAGQPASDGANDNPYDDGS